MTFLQKVRLWLVRVFAIFGLLWGLGLAAGIATAALLVVHDRSTIADPEYRFAISAPDSETFGALAVSPDGGAKESLGCSRIFGTGFPARCCCWWLLY